jgi:aryl-alcohol dehydrogenase-like predicted oxidoreductase
MEYGHVSGVTKPISRLVQGTVMINADNAEWGFKLLDDVFALGCSAFDTAHVYGGGANERTVGRWVRDRGVRDQVVIIGKGAHPMQGRERVTPEDITSDINESLERFGFDHIDLYLLHRDDPSKPVGPIVEVLNEHHRAGKIGAFGGSNWRASRIEEANAYAKERGLTPFVASSPNFSLAEQVQAPWEGCITISGPENDAEREWYANHQIALFTWSSLAGGFFSGRFDRDNLQSFDTYWDKLVVNSYCVERNFQRLDRVKQLGAEKGLTIPQVAMAYVMSQPLDIYALTGTNSGEEFRTNMEAVAVKLTPQELAWLDLRTENPS